MIVTASPTPRFFGLVDLASRSHGGEVLDCSDEFFAEAANLIEPDPPIFDPDRYTDHGKWMDGWESRRRRDVGEDWCVIRLGLRGRVRALDLDTSHFLGNHAPLAAVEGCDASQDEGKLELDDARWFPLVEQSPLEAGSHNLFGVPASGQRCVTHLRLTITPDGGVARLRALGEVEPGWDAPVDDEAQAHLEPGQVDLAALRHGGRALACSDMFFSPMSNLIAPGRSTYMGNGWETRRKRGPGHDWIVLRLAAPGTLATVELDTGHFHGNHAQRASLWGVWAPEARLSDLLAGPRSAGGWHEVLPPSTLSPGDWQLIVPERPLGPDRREFVSELAARGPFTHVRLETFPDGGVARLRIYGRPRDGTPEEEA